jgi:ribulose bisphosphate carboxylase small subunit
MSVCKITTGITNTCADLLKVGGVDQTFWVFYLSNLDTQISLLQSADINTLDFGSYGGLFRFDGNKFAHSFGSELVVTPGGNKHYKHTGVVKLLPGSTAEDVQLQTLNLGTDIGIVYQDNNRQFFILGAGNGLSVVSDPQSTGNTQDSDTTDTVTLEGAETTKPLRFALGGGYQATLDYLVSRQL